MKKSFITVFALVAILAAAAVLCACSGGSGSGMLDPFALLTDMPGNTQAAEATGAPEATEAPSVTDEPVITPEPEQALRYKVLPLDAVHSIDIDGDGLEENLLISSNATNEYDTEYSVIVLPGRPGADAFDELVGSGYDCYAMAVDNGTGDGSMTVLICYWCDSEDATTYALRGNGEGGFELILTFGYFFDPTETPEHCFENNHLLVSVRTDILGTQDVYTEVRFTEDGYESIDGIYRYPSYEGRSIAVIADMPAMVIDENTGDSYGITVMRGDSVVPVCTDLATYAVIRLSSGEEVYMFFDDYDWIPYINGKPQHDYLDVFYCD